MRLTLWIIGVAIFVVGGAVIDEQRLFWGVLLMVAGNNLCTSVFIKE